MYHGGQKLLERQRYQFPSSWLYVDNIEGEWGAYNEIMKRKDTAIQQQVSTILIMNPVNQVSCIFDHHVLSKQLALSFLSQRAAQIDRSSRLRPRRTCEQEHVHLSNAFLHNSAVRAKICARMSDLICRTFVAL